MISKREPWKSWAMRLLPLLLAGCSAERPQVRAPHVEPAPGEQAAAPTPLPSDWDGYLRGLSVRTLAGQTLHADPKVPARFNQRVAQLITEARARTRRITGIDAAPPAIYVHASRAMLRQREAIGDRQVAFYEGALHIAYVPREQELSHRLFDGVNHEYVHHALSSRGIHGPSWLEEALAMQTSRERRQAPDPQPPGLDLREMAETSPHRAPEELAERFYDQAQQMLELLQDLCGAEPGCDDRELVTALADGAPTDGFFEDVIAARAPSAEPPPLEIWQSYLAGVRPAR